MSNVRLSAFIGILIITAAVEASAEDRNIATLYRNSSIDTRMRIHVATFDADETNSRYNSENCQIAAELFESQAGVVVRYWCEPGRYLAHLD